MHVRCATLVLLLATTAASDTRQPPPEIQLRWAADAAAVECGQVWDLRSTGNRCLGRDRDKPFLVVAYAPTKAEPKVPVIRYEGERAGAPQRWLVHLDLGAITGEPVVAVLGDATLIAVI